MTLDEKLRLSYYSRIAPLNAEHGVFLVQHVSSRRVFVLKELTTYDATVFNRLKETPVKGIPRIYEAIEEGDRLAVIEQYVDAEPLLAILERRGVLPEAEALCITRQLAVILDGLHSMKPAIIHRDIKPSNVLVSDDGAVTLIDLDAAKTEKTGESRDTELIGTAGYAAPEQYGFAASTPQTDIYSVGVLLSVMLTGKLPNEAEVPGAAGRIIKKCTDMVPEKRYRSAQKLLAALNGSGGAEEAPENGTPEKERRFNRKYLPLGFRSLTPWKMIAAGAFYALLITMCATVDISSSGWGLWVNRGFMFAALITLVLLPSNFCGVLDLLGINKIKTVWVRVIVTILFTLFISFMLILIPSRAV